MFNHTASTRQPPAGGLGSSVHLDGLLKELRRGERDGFLRYFQHFRSPVYDFALRLLGDETAAVAATTEAFVVGFRQVIVDAASPDLRILTWQCALEACTARAAAQAPGAARTPSARAHETPRTHRLHGPSGPRRRFEAALEPLDLRQRAALLFHDLHGLSVAETAAIFAISEDAAGTLLFRAREQFRRGFDERSADLRGGTCRLAERAAAGAVGLGLSGDDVLRLRRHADYCKPCRATMKDWGTAPVGLAAFLEPAPLPRALSTPVFRGAAEAGLLAAAGAGVFRRSLGRAGRVVRSRTAAYVIAVACLALAVGVAAREDSVRQFILVQSAGPSIRLVTQPPSDKTAKADGGTSTARPSSSSSKAADPATSSQSLPAASFSTAQASSGAGESAGSGAGRQVAERETRSDRAPAASAGSGAGSVADAGVDGKTVGKSRRQGTKHKSHGARAHDRATAGHGGTKATHHGSGKAARYGSEKATHHDSGKAERHGRTKTAHHGSGKATGHARWASATHPGHSGSGHAASGRSSGGHGSSGRSHQGASHGTSHHGKSHTHGSGRSHGKKDR